MVETLINNQENIIRTWFEEHVAYDVSFNTHTAFGNKICLGRDETITTITWTKRDSIIHSILYLLCRNILYISGDCGAAIFKWDKKDLTFDWIKDLNIDYFVSKCIASEIGDRLMIWNDQVAIKKIRELINDVVFISMTDQKQEDCERNVSTQSDWIEFLNTTGYKYFGADYFEYSEIGITIATSAYFYLIGLKMAMEQLEQINKS